MPHPSEHGGTEGFPLVSLAERVALRTGIEVEQERLEAVVGGLAGETGRSITDLGRSLRPEDPDWPSFVERLVIPETYFFRDEAQIEAIREVILPELAARGGDGPPRLWSAGCSTGEEAYTLAFLAEEVLAPDPAEPPFVLGTDLCEASLERARRATCRRSSLRVMDEEAVERWLVPHGDGRWRVKDALRGRVRFSRHNLVEDPLPDPGRGLCAFDLILCRNVLQYLSQDAVAHVVQGLARCLAPGGYLVVAHAEADARLFGALEAVRLEGTIVHWRPTAERRAGSRRSGRDVREAGRRERRDWIEEGRRAADRGDTPKAIRALQRAVEQEPLSTEAHYLLGVLELEASDPDLAERHLRRVLLVDPEHLAGLAAYARHLRATGRHRRAAEHLHRLRRSLEGRDDDERPSSAEGMTVADLREVVATEESRCAAPGGGAG